MIVGVRASASASPTPSIVQLVKEGEEEDAQVKILEQDGDREQISAADYDPSLDRREDEQKRVRGVNDGTHDKPGTLDEVEEIEEELEEEELESERLRDL